ncbi:MAG TPA: CDP-alcohol phosphatidyltransferase family protein [Stellaceae bacterium]|nr:CDP-alcohol phosphatidyltransferase family protein [Stellaceae bacterium]
MRHSGLGGIDDSAASPLRHGAAAQLALLGAGLIAAVLPLGWPGRTLALALYAMIAVVALRGLGRHAPHRRFGAANAVTAARAAAVALLFGVWGEAALDGAAFSLGLRWVLVALAAAALAADGVDGWLARRRGLASDFGARFDMETDALLVLALSLLVLAAHQAAAFVLLSGAMRYVFVACGRVVPALAAPLPPRRRRKVVCVAQTTILILALAPAVPAWAGQELCAAGLALLAASFARDCVVLLSGGRGSPIMASHAGEFLGRYRRRSGAPAPLAPGRSCHRRSAPRRAGGAGP